MPDRRTQSPTTLTLRPGKPMATAPPCSVIPLEALGPKLDDALPVEGNLAPAPSICDLSP